MLGLGPGSSMNAKAGSLSSLSSTECCLSCSKKVIPSSDPIAQRGSD